MILKKEELLKMGAFEARVKECQKIVYPDMNALVRERWERDPEMNALVRERWEHEMDWIRLQHLEDGFLEMWNIVDEARTTMKATIGNAHRGLENSMVAYCLGLTATNPLPDEGLPEFPFPDINLPLNVGVTIDNENRNRLVQLAEVVYGKSMMRYGLPILKLNGIILEFFRC